MKRILLSLVAIVITSVCFAQDVIVKKDGSTIQAKVLEVSQTEVKYKSYSNQNGPTYTISTRDLQCINYENGSTDKFVSESYNPNIVTNETATQYSNDKQLLALYNSKHNYDSKAKTIKILGYTVGGVLVVTGAVLCLTSIDSHPGTPVTLPIGIASAGVGLGIGIGFNIWAHNLKKQSQYSVQSSPLYRQEFRAGKSDRLMVGVDLLKDNTYKHQTLGLGLAYNF